MGLIFSISLSALLYNPSITREIAPRSNVGLKVAQDALIAPQTPITTLNYASRKAREEGIGTKRFLELIRCESGWDPDASGDGGLAYGLLQFHENTFTDFSKKYNLNLNYKDPYDQIDLALLMIRDGYSYKWTCWK